MKKRVSEWIIYIFVAVLTFCFLKFRAEIESVYSFLNSNFWGLIIFSVIFIFILIITFSSFFQTLGPFEEETEETGRVLKKHVKLWKFFWIFWSIYCSVITVMFNGLDWKVFLLASCLAILPGCIAFNFSRTV